MALSNAEKQAAWRARRDAHTKELEAEVERLRNHSAANKKTFDAAVEGEVRKRMREDEQLRNRLFGKQGEGLNFNQRVSKEVNKRLKPFRPLTADEYKAVERCLHPDSNPSAERKTEAFRIWREKKDVLIEQEMPGTPKAPMPSAADLWSMKAAKQAKRKARRAGAKRSAVTNGTFKVGDTVTWQKPKKPGFFSPPFVGCKIVRFEKDGDAVLEHPVGGTFKASLETICR